MSRYRRYTTLKFPFTSVKNKKLAENDEDIISTIAYYSLQDQGFIPSSLDDMNDDIYTLLCGEAKIHIMKNEPFLYSMMNEWDSNRKEYWEQSRIIQQKQDIEYSISCSVDKKEKNIKDNVTTLTTVSNKYIFRTDTNRVVLNLTESDSYGEVVKSVGDKFILSSPGEDVITVRNVNSSLRELSIFPGKVYYVE